MNTVEVAIAIIVWEGQVLIARRKKDAYLGDLWEFPGGQQRKGERMEDCLLREVKEELDIDVHIAKLLCRIKHPYPERTVSLHAYLCHPASGIPKPLASQELRWVSLKTLFSFSFPDANRPILTILQEQQDAQATRLL